MTGENRLQSPGGGEVITVSHGRIYEAAPASVGEVSTENRPRYKKIKVTLSLPPLSENYAPRTISRTVLYAKEVL